MKYIFVAGCWAGLFLIYSFEDIREVIGTIILGVSLIAYTFLEVRED